MRTPSLPQRLKLAPAQQAWAAVIVAAVILVLRKPWALHTPQLWAEDGTIHLNENDQFGAAAFFLPYRGYLHLLPRIIAWFASVIADVAYWPAIYNWATFAVTIVLIARIASPRFEAPGKPWIALSFVLVAHSGEVFLNITNLHWLTDIFLVQQVLMSRPASWRERSTDWILVVLAGLSDPCALIFLPLFVWRWWRDRHADTLALLVLAAGCAAIQIYHLRTTGLHVDGRTDVFDPIKFLEVSGSRLVIWPFLGASAVAKLSPAIQGFIAWSVIAAIIGWSLRRDRHRPQRLWIVAAWVLITLACVYRIRPDKFPVSIDNLSFAEPYFFTSRLMLTWLVILEFNTSPRPIAWIARIACLASVALQLPNYRVAAPPDYHWAKECDPIRRGTKANIPILPEGWILQYQGRGPAGASR